MKQRTVKSAVWECITIAGIGSLAALAANAIHPDGVRLGRDYFPRNNVAHQPLPIPADPAPPLPLAEDEFSKSYLDRAAARLQQQGFQVIRHDEVVAVFNDPMTREGYYVFVDARADQAYAAGHIPGAYQLDHYRIEDYIDNVLPACMNAFKVIVYCSGGACEDSEFAALELFDRGLDPSKVFIYPGGVGLWKRKGQPLEQGAQHNGHLLQPTTATPNPMHDEGPP